MAGVLGFEPRNAGARNQCLTAWPYPIIKIFSLVTNAITRENVSAKFTDVASVLVCLTGIEPATCRLGGDRSIQLSYKHPWFNACILYIILTETSSKFWHFFAKFSKNF